MTPPTVSSLKATIAYQRREIARLEEEYDSLYEQFLIARFHTGSDNRAIQYGMDEVSKLVQEVRSDLDDCERALRLARKAGAK